MVPTLRPLRVLVAITILTLCAVNQVRAEDLSVDFAWSFVAHRQTSTGWETYLVIKDTVLQTGDTFKFYINRRTPCYIYLVHMSSQGELALLYPHRPDVYQHPPEVTAPVFLPKGDRWFELDDVVGQEKFFLLAAAKRLASLETLISRYAAAEKKDQQALLDQVLSEIKRLRAKHKRFKRKTEKPSIVLGQLRDANPDDKPSNDEIAGLSNAITAAHFYGRAFTIEHQ